MKRLLFTISGIWAFFPTLFVLIFGISLVVTISAKFKYKRTVEGFDCFVNIKKDPVYFLHKLDNDYCGASIVFIWANSL